MGGKEGVSIVGSRLCLVGLTLSVARTLLGRLNRCLIRLNRVLT